MGCACGADAPCVRGPESDRVDQRLACSVKLRRRAVRPENESYRSRHADHDGSTDPIGKHAENTRYRQEVQPDYQRNGGNPINERYGARSNAMATLSSAISTTKLVQNNVQTRQFVHCVAAKSFVDSQPRGVIVDAIDAQRTKCNGHYPRRRVQGNSQPIYRSFVYGETSTDVAPVLDCLRLRGSGKQLPGGALGQRPVQQEALESIAAQ